MYASHLYNAARQEKLLPVAWKDVELVITPHGTETIFTGDRPNGLEEFRKRFLLSMGYSASNFASNRRRTTAAVSTRGPKSLTKLCAIGELFSGRYCNDDKDVSWTAEKI